MTNERVKLSWKSPLGRRLWWVISGRAAAVIVLIIIGALWKKSTQTSGLSNVIDALIPLIITVVGLTGVYCVARLAWKNYLAQARIQFVFDVLLVTWLVWLTGNANSPYAALYIVIISVASFFVGPRAAMITSIGCVAAFNACAFLPIGSGSVGLVC